MREGQPANAEASIAERREFDSNEIILRPVQPEKQSTPSVSTDRGKQIDVRLAQPANVCFWIAGILEFDSNVTVSSRGHDSKHFAPNDAADRGMQIDLRDEQ
jgi:hypothetical protein